MMVPVPCRLYFSGLGVSEFREERPGQRIFPVDSLQESYGIRWVDGECIRRPWPGG